MLIFKLKDIISIIEFMKKLAIKKKTYEFEKRDSYFKKIILAIKEYNYTIIVEPIKALAFF